MDDLAVDSDEEVDYSKMDQVTTAPSMHQCTEQILALLVFVRFSSFLIHMFYFEGEDRKLTCVLFQGNKKGPLGRWDFDTQEEYSDYMNNKEALPKYVLLPSVMTDRLCQDVSIIF